MTEVRAAEELATEGSARTALPKMTATQGVLGDLDKKRTNLELPEWVSTKETKVVSCVTKDSEAKMAQATTTGRVEKVESESTNTLAPEVLIKVLTTQVSFFANRLYKIRIGIGENKSALYSSTFLVVSGAGKTLLAKPT